MPRFKLTTWMIVIAFQLAYGLAVFALTRAYYEGDSAQALAFAPMPPQNPVAAAAGGATGDRFRKFLEPSLELASDDPAVLARLGDEYFAQSNYPQAIAAYERAIQLNPADLDSHNDLGLALSYAGRTAEAIRVLKQGTAKAPDFQRIHLTLGFVQLHSGDRDAASVALQRAVDLGPDNTVGAEAKRMLDQLRQGPD